MSVYAVKLSVFVNGGGEWGCMGWHILYILTLAA